MNKELIFIFSLLTMVFLIRVIQGILIVTNKKILHDEVNYILFFYFTIICGIVVFTKQFSVGIAMLMGTPIIQVLYFAIVSKRIYWIVCGNKTDVSSFGNRIIQYDAKYADNNYFREHIFFKRSEGRIRVTFSKISYEEKESLLKIIKDEGKKHTSGFNVREFIYLCVNFVILIILLCFLLSVL